MNNSIGLFEPASQGLLLELRLVAKFRKNLNKLPNTYLEEENHLKVLRLVEANPYMTQRKLANTLGISVGKTNYCIKALLGKGFIKIENFSKNPNKLAYAYLLTPVGITEKAGLTIRFLERKIVEYESLTQEIEALKSEVKTQACIITN